MIGYTKVFSAMLDSSVWQLSKDARLLWVTMMLLKDRDQIVRAAVPGLAHRARLSVAETESALEELQRPDPYSQTPDHEGRRVIRVESGWLVVNGATYRDKLSEDDRREYQRIKQAEYRARKRAKAEVRGAAESREKRFVEADSAGEVGRADAIAAEGLDQARRILARNGFPDAKPIGCLSDEEAEELARQADQR